MAQQTHAKLPQFFKEAILEKQKAQRKKYPSHYKAAAFLDFDGSLIEGDITEGKRSGQNTYMGLLDLAIMGGMIPGFIGTEGLRAFWQKYEKEFPRPEEAYLWAAQLVSNLSDEHDHNLREFIQHHLGELVDKYLFSFARDLLDFCKEADIVPIVVSASPHFFVQELSSCMPIKREDLFGLSGRMESGNFIDPILHDSEGKEQRVLDLCAKRPLYPMLAMGNKWRWDGKMIQRVCAEGGVGLLVNEGGPSNYTHPSLFYFEIC